MLLRRCRQPRRRPDCEPGRQWDRRVGPGQPGAREISFESHLGGALIGILLAFLLRNHDPESPRKKYSWEHEEAESDDYDWPDQK